MEMETASDGSTGSDIPARSSNRITNLRSRRGLQPHNSSANGAAKADLGTEKDEGLKGLLQDLDSEILTIKNPLRDFTKFLDLKREHHSIFMTRLRDHVIEKSRWGKLQNSEKERRALATTFVDKYGLRYWGSANRQQYLLAESLRQPENLCIYPERKEVMIRAIMILLEKRSKTEKDLKPAGPVHLQGQARKQSVYHDRLTPELGTPEVEDNTNASAPVRSQPQSEETVQMDLTSGTQQSLPIHGQKAPLVPQSSDESFTLPIIQDQDASIDEALAYMEAKYMEHTMFLLTTDSEREMFPIHVPFHRFSRVAGFLAFMIDECIFNVSSTASTKMEHISAASVGFEWSDFKILVRPGREDDWDRVVKRLREEWLLREKGEKEIPFNGFNITVKLHIKKLK